MKKKRIREIALASQTRIVLTAAIWLSLFAYAGRPLLAGAAAAGIAPAVAWIALVALSALGILPMLFRRSETLAQRTLVHWTGYATLAIFSTLLVLVALTDAARVLYWLARWLFAAQTWPLVDARALSLGILAAALALTLVGLVQARCPRVRHVAVRIDELPPELDGYRIVQWSDVHVGPTIQRRFVESLVERTNALAPDAVAITGDLVDGLLDELREQVQPMRDLRARDGVFYVTGNHEYYWRASEWIPALESLGLQFLKNDHRVITRGDAKLVIAGVTDPMGRYTHKQDPDRALASAPRDAVKVLLSHRPQTAEAANRLGAHLQLSGHTHGGQFFPFNLIIKRFQPIVAGLHRVGGLWLYVNRGTGYWGPPSRLAVGGEITVIQLTR
ncbi:MAG: metallophosphoesterase [Acidobacteria bacterium]|nr:metallophosphoesterase [Acidobacteriota bacterium]MBV9474990.1 metallophosphoesterase [Acidobacteriota bacterium]